MLWAAIGGGARAGMQALDDKEKAAAEEKKAKRSIEERKSALLFEMKVKADFARGEREEAADVALKVSERGAAIGNERGASELEAARGTVPNEGEFAADPITPEMIAKLPPAARAVYEKDAGMTPASTLQSLQDQVTASRELGAPASLHKGLLDSYKTELTDLQKQREEARKDRQDQLRREDSELREEGRNSRLATTLAAQADRTNAVIAGAMARSQNSGGGGGAVGSGSRVQSYKTDSNGEIIAMMRDGTSEPTGRTDKSYADRVLKQVAAMSKDRKFSRLSPEDQVTEAKKFIAAASTPSGSLPKDLPAPEQAGLPTPKADPKATSTPWISPERQSDQVRAVQEDLVRQKARGNTENVKALERELARLGAPVTSSASSAPAAPAKKDNAPSQLPAGVSRESAISQAQAAIKAKPAAKAQVLERLRSWGIDTKGM